mmetsp:Transcript_6001/g.22738  ORF Transcript_6001/g.22738 Transcript_6001/m.22738 type:complete len:694 (+) Transcript_6001:2959-5040(+)
MTHLQLLTCSFYRREESQILNESPSLRSQSLQNASSNAVSSSAGMPPHHPTVPPHHQSSLLSRLSQLFSLVNISTSFSSRIKKYTCPLTKKLIVYPVRFQGVLYERDAFLEQNGGAADVQMERQREPVGVLDTATRHLENGQIANNLAHGSSLGSSATVDQSILVPLWKFRLKMALNIHTKLINLLTDDQRIENQLYWTERIARRRKVAKKAMGSAKRCFVESKNGLLGRRQTLCTGGKAPNSGATRRNGESSSLRYQDAQTRRVTVSPTRSLPSSPSDGSVSREDANSVTNIDLEELPQSNDSSNNTPGSSSPPQSYKFTSRPILSFPSIESAPNFRDHTKILFFIRELIFFTGQLDNKSFVQCRQMQQCYELYQYAMRLKTALLGAPGRHSLSYECNERIRRHIQLRLGIVGSVRALCQLKSEPNLLVSGSQEGQIDVWNMEDEIIVHTLHGHHKRIQTLTEMPDGRIISGSFDSELKVWDIENGECVKTIRGHYDQVSCVLALQDGKHFASCCCSCTSMDLFIRIWSYPECVEVQRLSGHYKGISQLIQLRDGHLVSCSADKTIRIWNLQSGTCVKILRKHAKAILHIVELHDGTLCAASQDGRVKIWDIHTGCCIKTFQAHKEPITSLIQLRDRAVVTSSWDRTIRFWNVKSGRYYTSVYNDGDCAYRLMEMDNGTLVAGSYERIQCYR